MQCDVQGKASAKKAKKQKAAVKAEQAEVGIAAVLERQLQGRETAAVVTQVMPQQGGQLSAVKGGGEGQVRGGKAVCDTGE